MSAEDKFEFDPDFQENVLQYTVTDKNGHRALGLYEDHYFTLLEHQVVASALKDFFKRKKRVPQSKTILREHLRKILLSKDLSTLSVDDKAKINKTVTRIYRGPIKDGDSLLDDVVKFARYISLRDNVEDFNLTSFDRYDQFAADIRKSISIGLEFKEERGTFLISGIRDRQFRRKTNDKIIPLPYRQMNKLTNAGGFEKGSVIVILAPEKEFKTGLLVNTGRKYLRMRKKILYIDLENGQDAIATRFEQSLMNKSKSDIISGQYDDKVLKLFRKYSRLGSEMDIKRMPAYLTTCQHIQTYIDEQYREFGIRYTDIIVDYGGLLGAISGQSDETARISDAYVDLKNLTERNKFDTCWTAAHTVRDADARFKTKFITKDIAKCIDIARHVDAIFGYQRSELDIQLGIGRLEVIDQRDGVQEGSVLFRVNYATQRADELSKPEVDTYYEALKQANGGEPDGKRKSKDLMD